MLVTYVAHEWTDSGGVLRAAYCPRLVFSQDDLCVDPDIAGVPGNPKTFDTVCRWAEAKGGSSNPSRRPDNRKVNWELQWPIGTNGQPARYRLCDDADTNSCVGLGVCTNNAGTPAKSKHNCVIDANAVPNDVVIKYRVESEAHSLVDGKGLGFDCSPLDPHFVIRR